MELELQYASSEDIPTGMEKLYTEKDGKFVFTGIKGFSNFAAEKATLTKSLKSERDAHAATKTKLTEATASIETLTTERDEARVTADAAGGKPDQAKIDEIVAAKVKVALAPVERKLQAAESRAAEFEGKFNDAQTRERQSSIRGVLSKVALDQKMDPASVDLFVQLALPDFDLTESGAPVARENARFAVGGDAGAYLGEFKAKHPNFWPENVSGGARGGGNTVAAADNPYTYGGWNVTKQMGLPEDQARKLAKAAGVNFDRPVRPQPPKS